MDRLKVDLEWASVSRNSDLPINNNNKIELVEL